MKQDRKENFVYSFSKIFSVIALIASAVFVFYNRKYINIDSVINLTSGSVYHACLVLLALFFCKTFIVFFPVMILFAASGTVLPLWTALAVNYLGAFIINTLQYFAGRHMGTNAVSRLAEKYPKFDRLYRNAGDADWIITIVSRMAGMMPADIISLFLGALKVGFLKYTLGSLIGMTPMMIACVVAGKNILNPNSPEFITACIVIILLTAAVLIFYEVYMKNNKLKQGAVQKKYAPPSWTRILLRRRVFVILLLCVQLALIILMFYATGTKYAFIKPSLTVLSYCVMLYILSVEDKPAYKISWVVLTLAFPVFGGILYIVIRNQGSARKIRRKFAEQEERTMVLLPKNEDVLNDLKCFDSDCCSASRYLAHYVGFPVYRNTEAVYFPGGEQKIDRLMEELKKAEKFIFLEYFIISEGAVWDSILEILEEKAAAGVDVRVIYDDIGCFMLLPHHYDRFLESKGIKTIMFNPFRPVLSTIQNNRDHRKIAVIDGKTAFTGGVNLADEYINAKVKHGVWKDAAIMVKGEAVWSFTVMFLQVWNVYRDTDDNFEKFRTETGVPGNGFCQPYGDMPLDKNRVAEHIYMSLINRANDYLYITTPYLILEDGMNEALCEAARSGVDIKIITPHIPDKIYVHTTTRSYYRELCDAGIEIYEFTDGFIHSKTFVSDDKTATVGTINLDYRSLYLHFECGVLIHDMPAVADIKSDFLNTLKKCTKITKDDVKGNILSRSLQKIMRLFAPFM